MCYSFGKTKLSYDARFCISGLPSLSPFDIGRRVSLNGVTFHVRILEVKYLNEAIGVIILCQIFHD